MPFIRLSDAVAIAKPVKEKRKLVDFVLSNSIWKNGELLAEYRQPFDVLVRHLRLTTPYFAIPLNCLADSIEQVLIPERFGEKFDCAAF